MRDFGKLRAYRRKNKRLKWLGYSSYQEYLLSPEWKEIRRRVLARDNFECVACGAAADCVHHNGYHTAALTGRSLDALFSLCNDCHEYVEFINGQKVGMTVARDRLRDRCKMNRRYLPGRCQKCMKGPPRTDSRFCRGCER